MKRFFGASFQGGIRVYRAMALGLMKMVFWGRFSGWHQGLQGTGTWFNENGFLRLVKGFQEVFIKGRSI